MLRVFNLIPLPWKIGIGVAILAGVGLWFRWQLNKAYESGHKAGVQNGIEQIEKEKAIEWKARETVALLRRSDSAELKVYLQDPDNARLFRLAKLYEAGSHQLSALTGEIRKVQEKDWPDHAKQARIRVLYLRQMGLLNKIEARLAQ